MSTQDTFWTSQSLALSVLALAHGRDPGNRNNTWTAHEVRVADELDDHYLISDLAGFSCGSLYLAEGDL